MHPNQYKIRDNFKIEQWEYITKMKIKELDLIEVDQYFDLPYGTLSNIKSHSKEKWEYIISFDK